MTHALELVDLGVRTADASATVLVREVSFALDAGQCLCLLGESGSGKSLLAQTIMGTLPADLRASGEIRLNGEAMRADAPRRDWWGRRLALLPQEPWLALDPTMPAHTQVAETHRFVGGQTWPQARAQATLDLAALGLGDLAAKYPFMLSGGMAQRVAFAATCAGGAPVLIVDEPTKGLDAALRDGVVALLRDLLARGGSVLAITHDVAVARALNGDVAVMLEAEVVERGTAAQVLGAPQHGYTQRLLAAEPAAWPRRANTTTQASGTALVHARGLAKSYGPHRVFGELDLTLHAGERIAIVGASGSGKTTLGNVLLGLNQPDAGRVERAAEVGPLGFQKLYQDPTAAFAPRIPLRQSLQDLLRLHRLRWDEVPAWMGRLRLSDALLDRRPDQVSGGELQRLALLRVLLLKPRIVFADEPTSRLDPLTQRETFELLGQALDDQGSALLLVTHDPDIAGRVADRMINVGPGR